MRRQRTLAREVVLEGVGLHHGKPVRLLMRPAPAGAGLVFVRDDLGGLVIPALQQYRGGMVHASRLTRDQASVDTPEHLLAALFGLGIDNVRLHMDSAEVPILDGSAVPFARAILEAGTTAQDAWRPEVVITQPVAVEDEGRRLEIIPGSGLRLTAGIDFEHRHLGYQDLTVQLDDPGDFLAKLAPARTFGLRGDVEKLMRLGLARGGSLDSAILVDEEGIQGHQLRFPDEFVRHKLLDLVGDLALLGCGLSGRIIAWRSGHDLHGRLVDAILSARTAWIFEPGPSGPAAPPSRPTPPGQTRIG